MEAHRKIYTELSTLASLSSETRLAEVRYFSLIELPEVSRWITSGSDSENPVSVATKPTPRDHNQGQLLDAGHLSLSF